MHPEELIRLLRQANEAQRAGYTRKEIDAYLLNSIGMTKRALSAAVQALPKAVVEDATSEVTTAKLNEQLAYGLTLGWLDEMAGVVGAIRGKGYTAARDAARSELKSFEKAHPLLANSMRLPGGMVPALATGGAAALAGAPPLAAAAGLGAVAGGGGMIGEGEGVDRVRNAIVGGATGATAVPAMRGLQRLQARIGPPAADAAAAGGRSKQLKDLLKLLGAGAGGSAILDYLTDR